MPTDLTFFTNETDATLLDRFKSTLKDVQFFDVLVGYFRTSGFHLLHEAFEDIEKIRILVGLNIDSLAFEIIEQHREQMSLVFQSSKHTKEAISEGIAVEMERSSDTYEIELGVRRFIEFLNAGKLEIKAHPSQSIHAKVYISRFLEDDRDFGRVITGSSNFSQSGLQGNYEFNVEMKNSADVKFALEKFDVLWAEAVDISDTYVETINKRTWLNDQIKPYELYLKFLYEYFKEDINIDQEVDTFFPPGFLELEYQKQAALSARKILESYNGVFIADVVGLGKTYISALLAQQLPGRKLVICPPVLKDYWRRTFFEFNIGGTVVESMGKLDHILKTDFERFEYVFIDEAHRFRNEGTQGYEKLHQICFGKKVILVSATPLNNTIQDIFAQLKLFQIPKKSTIPGARNLEHFFKTHIKRINLCEKEYKKGSPEYVAVVKDVAAQVRERILKYVMVRRTRFEIVNYFRDDLQNRGLFFPEIASPNRIVYKFDAQTDRVFTETIKKLKTFQYARYTPLLFLKTGLSDFEAQQQRNVGGFMKGILVKRLESSFFAFKNTLRRFIASYERFIEMHQNGTIYIGKDVNIYDLMDRDDEEEIQRLLEEDKLRKYHTNDFRDDFLPSLMHDLNLLRSIQQLWRNIEHDPKLAQFINELKNNTLLQKKKVIIFTESSETGKYLYEGLDNQFPGKVVFCYSGGGLHKGETISKSVASEIINENYDPNSDQKRSDIRILISTELLAEGINLHRSNIVVNYDLPWNPMRVLQRVGRVNRVGTKHEMIHIFNFFPTSQSDEHLGLEDNIKAKIQAFHDMLGEDAKYLTEEEDVTQHELFGDRLYHKLNHKGIYLGEEEERSELEFLQVIRDVRDKKPDTFEKIKRLPKKARSGRKSSKIFTHQAQSSEGTETSEISNDALVSFFRRGRLKKFYLTSSSPPAELTFLEAVDLLRCAPDTAHQRIPRVYYELLARNKAAFAEATDPESEEFASTRGGFSNVNYILRYLKAIRKYPRFTDDDESYVKAVIEAFELGIIPKKTSQTLKLKLERETNPLMVLEVLKSNISSSILYARREGWAKEKEPVEVILSEYLQRSETL